MDHKKTEAVPSRFQPGDKVRVKHGVRDPDFPDIPLGGWAGTVKDVPQSEDDPTLLVAWDRATLKGMHPIYKKRCERDGLELESMWLGQEDLEPDDGTPIAMEQPTSIVTKPLSEKDQDDRVRMALGLTHDDPLLDVCHETLRAYYLYLAARLKFPFKAKAERDGEPLNIQRLVDPKECDLDEEGLLCEARNRQGPFDFPLSEVEGGGENRRLVADFGYWFHNGR